VKIIIQVRRKTFITLCGKYIQDNKYKMYQNLPGFVDDVTKNIWCVFGFTVPIAVHLQKANVSFTR